jgi:hypothetical protein
VLLFAMWLLMAHLGIHNRSYFGKAVLACLAYLPLMACLLQGQTTSMALLLMVLAVVDIKKMREFRAGIWLSLTLIKFQVLPPFLILFFFKRRWKLLAGFLAGGLPLLFLSLYILGPRGLLGYFQLLIKIAGWTNGYGVSPAKALCLRGQVFLLMHSCCRTWIMPLCIGINLGLLALLCWYWRGRWDVRGPAFNLKFALTTMLSLLMAPHINFHDLTLMLPAGLFILHFATRDQEQAEIGRFTVFVLIVVAYPILLITLPVSGVIPIQMVVLGFLLLSGLLMKQLSQFESREGQS